MATLRLPTRHGLGAMVMLLLSASTIITTTLIGIQSTQSPVDSYEEYRPNNNLVMGFTWGSTQLPTCANVRRVSNYALVSAALSLVQYYDGAYVAFSNTYLLDVCFDSICCNGSISFYGRITGVGGPRTVVVTAHNDPTTIYGSQTLTNSTWQWFAVQLGCVPMGTTQLDIRLSSAMGANNKLYIDVVSLNCPPPPTDKQWHDILGNIITNFTITIWYNVTTSGIVNNDHIWMELWLNATYLFTNASHWRSSFVADDLIQVPSLNVAYQWQSSTIALPMGPPPNNETQIQISIGVTAEVWGQINDTVTWVYDKIYAPNLRTMMIYWY